MNYKASQVRRLKEVSRLWSRCSESEQLRTTPKLQVLYFWFTPSSDKKPAGICAWCLYEDRTDLTHSLGGRGYSNKASLTWKAHVKIEQVTPPCYFMLKLSNLGRTERGFPCAAYLEPPRELLDAQSSKVPSRHWGLTQRWILLWVLKKTGWFTKELALMVLWPCEAVVTATGCLQSSCLSFLLCCSALRPRWFMRSIFQTSAE